MHALVLDGELKSALASVRALGRAGVTVTACASRGSAMALHSRYTKRRSVYRSALKDPEGFLLDVLSLLDTFPEPPVLFAFSDATALTLARNRHRFENRARMPLPSADSVETAFDKEQTLTLARYLAIPIPLTYTPRNREEATRMLVEISTRPIVVKPRTSASWKEGKGTTGTAEFALSPEEAHTKVEAIATRTGVYPLLEAYIRGGEYGFEALCHRGEILASMAHRRIRSLSPTGGAAVVKETIEPDSTMKSNAEKLLRALMWTGPAMVEFKHDDAGGEYLLLEINGRFWGSLPLAIHAGLDFPNRYMALAHGHIEALRALPKDGYTREVCSRHFLGDLRHLLRVLFAHDSMRAIAYPTRKKALADFFRRTPDMRYDVYDSRDPLPAFMEVINRF